VWYPSRKGEDLNALFNRLAGFVSVFVPEFQRRFACAASPHKRIMFVGHAASVIGLAQAWLGDRNVSFQAACCSMPVLDRKAVTQTSSAEGDAVDAGGDWTARVLGNGDHLKDGLLRGWGFENITLEDGKVSHRCILQVAHIIDLGITSTFGAYSHAASGISAGNQRSR
jgi:transcription factor C subunit 7